MGRTLELLDALPRLDLTTSEAAVWTALALHADEDCIAFPGADRIATYAKLSPRRVRDALARMQAKGAIAEHPRSGRNGCTRWVLRPDGAPIVDRTERPIDAAIDRTERPVDESVDRTLRHHRPDVVTHRPDVVTHRPDAASTEPYEPRGTERNRSALGGLPKEDTTLAEETSTMVVRGRVAPDPDAPTELQVAELVALQQTAMPSRADHDAVTRLLVKPGVTAEVARAMWEAAAADDWWQETTDTGEPRLRWRSLAKPGPGLDKRIGAAQEAVAELARRAWRNRAPDPPPPKKTFDIFAKKRFETNEQHEQRVRNLRAMMAGKTADGASK